MELKYKILSVSIFLLALALFILPLTSAATIDLGTNLTASGNGATLYIDTVPLYVDTATIYNNNITLTNVICSNNPPPSPPTYNYITYVHSTANTTIRSSSLCPAPQVVAVCKNTSPVFSGVLAFIPLIIVVLITILIFMWWNGTQFSSSQLITVGGAIVIFSIIIAVGYTIISHVGGGC